MHDITDYIFGCLSSFNPRRYNPRAALALLHEVPGIMDNQLLLTRVALDAVEASFSNKIKKDPQSVLQVPMTNTAIRIGEALEGNFNFPRELTTHDHAHVGVFIVEALFSQDYLSIEYGKTRDSSYELHPEPKWFTLLGELDTDDFEPHRLTSTLFTKPKDISGSEQYGQLVCKQFDYKDADVFKERLDKPFIKGMNNIQQVPWMLNDTVARYAFEHYEGIERPTTVHNGGKTPFKAASKLYEKTSSESNRIAMETARVLWTAERTSQQKLSEYLSITAILAKAKRLVGIERFYSLTYLDFRSRNYYSEAFLYYQGSDLARSLLTFREGTVLDLQGLQELKYHTANSFNATFDIGGLPSWLSYDYETHLRSKGLDTISVDKMTYKDRSKWVNANWQLILHVAETGMCEEALCADKPWVFLSCCVELANWWKNRRTFKSSLPVAIDGCVNAYQHMAAISKDDQTGSLVALTDTEVPTDLYVEVAKDLVNRNPDFFKKHPITIPKLRKCVSKVSTMLKSYSAGLNTISEDVATALDDAGVSQAFGLTEQDQKFLADESVISLANICPQFSLVLDFLTQIVEAEIGDVQDYDDKGVEVKPYAKVKLTNQIKKIYRTAKKADRVLTPTEVAEVAVLRDTRSKFTKLRVSGEGTKELRWETPAGFPVVFQSYNTVDDDIYTTLKGFKKSSNEVHLKIRVATDKPMKQKFLSGICPNLIHSFDASQLLMLASRFDGPFGPIHDSFSTTAGRMTELRELNKEIFVEMYGRDNMFAYLREQLLTNPDNPEVITPELGNLNLEDVKKSKYFFS